MDDSEDTDEEGSDDDGGSKDKREDSNGNQSCDPLCGCATEEAFMMNCFASFGDSSDEEDTDAAEDAPTQNHTDQLRAALTDADERATGVAVSKAHMVICRHQRVSKIKLCELTMNTILRPDKRLDDTCIEGAFRLLTNGSEHSWYLPNSTLWFQKLAEGGYRSVKTWRATKLLRTWVRALWHHSSQFAEDRILIPVHRPGHWVLICINLQQQRLEHYDSLHRGDSAAQAEFQTLRRLIEHMRREDNSKAARKKFEWAEDFIPGVAIPQQYDLSAPSLPGVDCGVFATFFAIACREGIDLTQEGDWQQSMVTLRKRIVLAVAGRGSL